LTGREIDKGRGDIDKTFFAEKNDFLYLETGHFNSDQTTSASLFCDL